MQYNSNKDILRVATRTSNLALRQVEEIFSDFPGLDYKIIPIQSFGDKNKAVSLINNKVQDFFTRELDTAILNNEADIAVHSAKDLPYPLPQGLEVIALFEAFDKSDSIVSRDKKKLCDLSANPVLGTSSLLRKTELLKIRKDIRIESIRGTIEERIKLVDEGIVDAVVVATCALKRLGLQERISEVLPFETHPLQGNLAIVAKTGNGDLKEFFLKKDIRRNYGKVWLVGFGPGHPDLLTIRGQKVLESADIIFHDDLLNSEYLSRFHAELTYVGKRKDKHSFEQDQINLMMYNAAIKGKTIVRLKGGDPMIFAHGGEEIEYLRSRFVETEVVPGITAALAGAAFAQIPLTHRGISSSVSFISGHSGNIEVPSTNTLVYYMGAANLHKIAEAVIAKGRNPQTPVLLVYNVSGTGQEQFYTTLQKARDEKTEYKTPLLIIIGDVVGLKNHPAENIIKPVFYVTGNYPEAFNNSGEVIHDPLIEIEPVKDLSNLRSVLGNLQHFQWIILTSRYAVRYFFEALYKMGKDARTISGINIASIGRTTTSELIKNGIIPDLQPEEESSEGMIRLFHDQKISGQKILIPRSDIGLPVLPEGLRNLRNNVLTIAIYTNSIPQKNKSLNLSEVDYVVLSSPSCVDNFFLIYGGAGFNKKYIVRGNETFKRLKNYQVPDAQILKQEEYETLTSIS